MRLTEKKASVTQRVLLYGAPKTGKSYLAAKLAERYKLIWFDCEQGWSTLLQLPKEWQERIDIISVPDSRVYPIAAETWLKVIKGAALDICDEHGKVACALCKKDSKPSTRVCLNEVGYDTVVVFDSLTQLTNSLISHVTKAQPDDYKLQLDDWGNLRVLIDKFLSQVQSAGYNIVCITHEEQVTMEDGKNKLVPSSGSSKSSMNTAKYFDHVVYCELKNRKHTFGSSTEYGMNMVTGSRTGVVMEKAAEPSLLDIFTSWKAPAPAAPAKSEAVIEVSEAEKKQAELAAAQKEARIDTKLAEARTPGQIALENMKARAAATLADTKTTPKV
jgi:hypothetical protein